MLLRTTALVRLLYPLISLGNERIKSSAASPSSRNVQKPRTWKSLESYTNMLTKTPFFFLITANKDLNRVQKINFKTEMDGVKGSPLVHTQLIRSQNPIQPLFSPEKRDALCPLHALRTSLRQCRCPTSPIQSLQESSTRI